MKKSRKNGAVNAGRWVSYAAAAAVTAVASNEAANDASAAILYSAVLNTPAGSLNAALKLHTLISNGHPGAGTLGTVVHKILTFSHVPATQGAAYFRMNPAKNGQVIGQIKTFSRGPEPYASNLGYHVLVNAAAAHLLGVNTHRTGTNAGPIMASQYGIALVTHFGYSHNGNGSGTFGHRLNSRWEYIDSHTHTGFLGFTFKSGAQTEYGWAQVTMAAQHNGPNPRSLYNTFTLVDYAYTTNGDQIYTTPQPEPASLGLLAMGLGGLVAMRKALRKQKAVS